MPMSRLLGLSQQRERAWRLLRALHVRSPRWRGVPKAVVPQTGGCLSHPANSAERPVRTRGPSEGSGVGLSPTYLAIHQERRQGAEGFDLSRLGGGDRFPLRLPSTRAEVDGGDVPALVVTMVRRRPDSPSRHPRDGVVESSPGTLPLVVGHRPRLRRMTRQATNAATSTVTAMIASDQR